MSLTRRFTFPLTACCLGILVALSTPTHFLRSQQASCVVNDIDTPTMPGCVIQSRNGALYIPRQYWMHPHFNRYGLTAFMIESFGAVYVNRSGRIVIRDVAYMDNFPAEFHHGLVGIKRNGMSGYADPSGRIVVPPKYSCALNHQDKDDDIGPLVCVGCRIEQEGEYHACLGGQWFKVDSYGHLEPAPSPNPEPKAP
jgi:hypothetical protein